MKQLALVSLLVCNLYAVTVTIQTPQPSDLVGKKWETQGTATATSGTISTTVFSTATATLSTSSTTITLGGITSPSDICVTNLGQFIIGFDISGNIVTFPGTTLVSCTTSTSLVLSHVPTANGSGIFIYFSPMSYMIDGGSCGGTICYYVLLTPGTSWLGTLFFTPSYVPVGTHTLVVSAVDTAGNVGSSTSTSITVVQSTPTCSMTSIPGSSFTCVKAGTDSTGTGVAFTGGYNAGDIIYVYTQVLVPGSPTTSLGAAITTTSQTVLTLNQPASNGATATLSTSSNTIVLTSPTTPSDVCSITRKGQTVTGAGIPANTYNMGCDPDNLHLVLSQRPTSNTSGVAITLTYTFPSTPFYLTLTDDVYGTSYEQVQVTTLNPPSGGLQTGTMVRGVNGTTATTHGISTPVGWYRPGPFPSDNTMISNTLGYTWHQVLISGSDFTDQNTVQNLIVYAVVPSNTSSSDTITFSAPYRVFPYSGSENIVDAIVYRGLGSLGNTNTPQAGWGGFGFPANASMTSSGSGGGGIINSWSVTPGDLCISAALGSLYYPVNSGVTLIPSSPLVDPSASAAWVERIEDGGRPLSMILDAVATDSKCNGGALVVPGDGVTAMGVAFHSTSTIGFSAEITSSTFYYNTSLLPNQPTNRMEIYIHDWDNSNSSFPIYGALGYCGSTGWEVYQIAGSIFDITNHWSTGTTVTQVNVSGLTHEAMYLRLQHDSTNLIDYIEAFDENNNRFFFTQVPYTSESNPGGTDCQLGAGGGGSAWLGWVRSHSTLIPLNSTPPETVNNTARVWELKLDGNLNDASGNSHGFSVSGTANYEATPYRHLTAAITTSDAPFWTNTISQRAGKTSTLSCGNSATQNDLSNVITSCFWQELSGPATLLFNHNSMNPGVRFPVYGDYLMQLIVTDSSGASAITTVDIGAVATDDNYVVVNADPNVDSLLGLMIMWGHNPWGLADQFHKHASDLRKAVYDTVGWTQYQWEQLGSGTVSYYFNGVGPNSYNFPGGTTITSSINATTLTIPIADYTTLDLSDLPTRVLVASAGMAVVEETRICSYTVTVSPAANLNVCYDGRGAGYIGSTFLSGAFVMQNRVSGASTHFLTDSTAPVCPLGAGPGGPSIYNTGTITLTAGSTSVTGSGTTWTSALNGYWLRVAATHSATPFVFIAQISTASGTSMTLSRAFPSDADTAGGLTYNITSGIRTLVLRNPYTINLTDTSPTSHLQLYNWSNSGCESETSVYINIYNTGNTFGSGHDVTLLNGTLQSGYPYSVTDQQNAFINQSSTGGIDFYNEGAAHRSLCYSSGLKSSCDAANALDDHFVNSPWNFASYGGDVLFEGGIGIGGFQRAVLGGSVDLWPHLRAYANLGAAMITEAYGGGTPDCFSDDSRDRGYGFSWPIFGAIYDPNSTFKSLWQSYLPNMQAMDSVCKHADNSWSDLSRWNNLAPGGFGPVTLTNGSKAVTGTGFVSTNCNGTASGTGTITTGGTTLSLVTGTVPAPLGSGFYGTLAITGTNGGNPLTVYTQYLGSGSTSVTISVQWPGDTGSVTWMSGTFFAGPGTAVGGMMAFATGLTDVIDQSFNYLCIYNSPTSLTLDRNWAGVTGSSYYGYGTNSFNSTLTGYGQQPFMLGIRGTAYNWLANIPSTISGTVITAYKSFLASLSQWEHDTGFDTPTKAINYGRVMQFCEPATISTSTAFDFRQPGCTDGTSLQGYLTQRQLNTEAMNTLGIWYQNNPSPTNKAWVDGMYGAIWGNQFYNTGGVYWDANSVGMNIAGSNFTDAYLTLGKYFGQCCGMGFIRNWPAIRLGLQPVNNKTLTSTFALSAVPGATQIKLTVTSPNGATNTVTCTVSPCSWTADARQGNPLIQIDYWNNTKVIFPGSPVSINIQ